MARAAGIVLFSFAVVLSAGFLTQARAGVDPQGALDSFYVECGLTGDTLVGQLRFFSDNTDTNRIAAIGMPILITVSNNALVQLDTTLATTFAGSIVSRFALKTTSTDPKGGANPAVSPVQFVMGAITLDSGLTGTGLFANMKLILNADTATVTFDTLSTNNLNPMLVTEKALAYTPGWKQGGFRCIRTDVKEVKGNKSASMPSDFSLGQNYPNPFNATTSIQFALPKSGRVKLEIFNILGQKVRTLVDEVMSAGYKQVVWEGKDQGGDVVPSGIYFYRIKAEGSFADTKKMVLIK